MRTRLAFALTAALLAPAVADDKTEAAKKDSAKLQGTWDFVSMELDGQPVPKAEIPQTITFDGNKFAVKAADKVVQAGTQTLDPTQKPKTVDAPVTEGQGQGTTMLGIYEVDGDTLKACFDVFGKKRPTEFKTAAGTGHMLAVMKRRK